MYVRIQDVPGGKVNTVGDHSIGHSNQESVYVNVSYYERVWRKSYFTVQKSNTPCPHTSSKVHWCRRWNFRKCIILNCTNFVT
jgi:hypothetical protein